MHWLTIDMAGVDADPGFDPMIRAEFQILRPVIVRLNISPRNKDTGETICEGRIISTYDAPTEPDDILIPVASLAGLDNCTWTAGEYVANITLSLTDFASGVQLQAIPLDVTFEVRR